MRFDEKFFDVNYNRRGGLRSYRLKIPDCFFFTIILFSYKFDKDRQHLSVYNSLYFLNCDKGSRAVNHILGCSSGNTAHTRTIYISYESLYLSSFYDIRFFNL